MKDEEGPSLGRDVVEERESEEVVVQGRAVVEEEVVELKVGAV